MIAEFLRAPTKSLFSLPSFSESDVLFLGVPFDSNTSCRPGSRFAPWYVRLASEFMEEYSILYNVDIRDLKIGDYGDIDVSFGDFKETIRRATSVIRLITKKKLVFLGGDHTVTIVIVNALKENIGKLVVLDAHADFYDEYQGNRFSHACTIRRLSEIIGAENISVLGIRSASKKNLEDMQEFGIEYYTIFDLFNNPSILEDKIKSCDYLSIDLDFFDPSHIPNVSCPEPLGFDVKDFFTIIPRIGAKYVDITELVPFDPLERSAIITASLLREILIRLALNR